MLATELGGGHEEHLPIGIPMADHHHNQHYHFPGESGSSDNGEEGLPPMSFEDHHFVQLKEDSGRPGMGHQDFDQLYSTHNRSRRISMSNPLSYNPDLLDVYNFHGGVRPRRPSFSGTFSLSGIDIIPPSTMSEDDSILQLENQFCKDLNCCGTQFPNLHELLAHYETVHVNVRDFTSDSFPEFSLQPQNSLQDDKSLPDIDFSTNVHHHQQNAMMGSNSAANEPVKLELIQEEDDHSGPQSFTQHPSQAQGQFQSRSLHKHDGFPSPAPSNASATANVGYIQEGMRHLHLGPLMNETYFNTHHLGYPPPQSQQQQQQEQSHGQHQHLTSQQPPSSQHMSQIQAPPEFAHPQAQEQGQSQANVVHAPLPKRPRAPSLIAANVPDDTKKARPTPPPMNRVVKKMSSSKPSTGASPGNVRKPVEGSNAHMSVYIPSASQVPPVTPPMEFTKGTQPPSSQEGNQSFQDALPPAAEHTHNSQMRPNPQMMHQSPQMARSGSTPVTFHHSMPRNSPSPAPHHGTLSSVSEYASSPPQQHQPLPIPFPVGSPNHVQFLEQNARPNSLPPHLRSFMSSPHQPPTHVHRPSTPGTHPHDPHHHFHVPSPPPRPSSTPAVMGMYPTTLYNSADGGDYGAMMDDGSGSPLGMMPGGGKRYKCPKPFCSKVYKNSNGLKYHLEHGNCEMDYAATSDGGANPDSPHMPATHIHPIPHQHQSPTLHHALPPYQNPATPPPSHDPYLDYYHPQFYPYTMDIKIALRPYWCRVQGCGKKYKNLNGLKYHAKVCHPDMDFKGEVKGHSSMSL
ncbi:hypothetical protein DFS34DRAFT_603699 [Phlyctochytrium arcticum]|nr:hypothetical protein DFS34DRAFT_603699 [Phlyctochytrium arcticum]